MRKKELKINRYKNIFCELFNRPSLGLGRWKEFHANKNFPEMLIAGSRGRNHCHLQEWIWNEEKERLLYKQFVQ